ncbi:MAG TPA: ATP-binding protein [Gemmatimonadales bacterium]|nr:ATP-binding protein [Gemmatimonadales bacterium]
MSHSLRRTLAVRFAATMAVALTAASAAIFWSEALAAQQHLDRVELLVILAAVVLLGSGATLVGAWRLARSAVRPVGEITAQATLIEAGTLNQRIAAHADTDEYRGLVAVLNRMLDRLEQGFHAQQRLTADVGHELRTPLTALRGLMEVALRTERSPGEYQRVLRSGLEEMDRLTTLAEDLLLITRAESHLLKPERVAADPNAMIERALQALDGRIAEKKLVVERVLDPRAKGVSLDPQLVGRLIDHLVDNAVKFTPPWGRLLAATEAGVPTHGGVRLAVQNSGSQIAAADLPHVFEPFYQADPARPRGGGSGLGLALVAAIARLHGGEARAWNLPGEGVRFEVDLPAPAVGAPSEPTGATPQGALALSS